MMRGAASAMVVESANAVLAEIFGPDSRAFVEAMYLKNEILGIRVAGSAGSMEIRLREREIIDKISEKFGGQMVKKIKFIC